MIDIKRFNEEEIKNLIEAGYTPEEIHEHEEERYYQWENMKRLWDGKPQIKNRRKNQTCRNIDETFVSSMK